MIDQSQSEAEQDRDDSGKQDKKCNVGFQSVSAENVYPDICLVSAVNRIDNSGVIGGVSGQFNTELLAGIGSINRAENITAGGVFAHKPCFTRGIAGSKAIPYIKIHILQGRTDGKAGICKIIGKLDGKDHRVTDGNLVGARNGDFLGGSIRFLPGNGTGIDHRGCWGVGRTFIRTKDLHKNKPAKDGEHQNIKEISFSLVKGFCFFFHGNMPPCNGKGVFCKLKNSFRSIIPDRSGKISINRLRRVIW